MFDANKEAREANLEQLAQLGWTLSGWLTFSHILDEFETSANGFVTPQRMEEIAQTYGAGQDQIDKIVQSFKTIQRAQQIEQQQQRKTYTQTVASFSNERGTFNNNNVFFS